ncbi:MAG: potassium/proton antiporter [Coriobacteriales bacterium]|jgi:cell volume regulation protein A|nr:potassium/proton antiporter [Coriobacteriales bacterium]
MVTALAIGSIIVLVCISFGQFIHRFGMPALVIFLVLGIIAGSLPFEYSVIEPPIAANVGEAALIFVMFYGGFGTNWKIARTVAVKAGMLASLGVIITAGAVMLFTVLVFHLSWIEGFLFGSIIGCTDAASVFSILRSKKMNLKHNTVSVLEIENGSNDPTAYLLTLVALLIMQGGSLWDVPLLVAKQIVFGVGIGIGIAVLAVPVILRFSKHFADGMDLVFVFAIAILTFALAQLLGGNGYLAAFLCGIILGNSKIPNKVRMAHFFDSVDWLGQIMIFFFLGLLVTPANLIPAILPAIALALFLLFIARPLAVFLIFRLRGSPLNQCLLISWVGLRGAASLVFAVLAITSGVVLQSDIFHIVVLTAFFSILIQGTLLEPMAKRLNMIDTETDVMQSFTDFQEHSEKAFLKIRLDPGHAWVGHDLKSLDVGQNSLIVLIKRGNQTIAPKGDTVLMPDDIVVMTAESYTDTDDGMHVERRIIEKEDPWAHLLISDLGLPSNALIVAVEKKDGTQVTPKGWTKINPEDAVTIITWDA